MADNVHELNIGDNTFYIRRINALEAWPLFGDLQRELLPAVSELLIAAAGAPPEGEEAAQDEGRLIANAVRELSARLDGEQLQRWTKKLIKADYISVSINGAEPTKLDERMQAIAFEDFTVIPHLLFEVLKFNFAKPLAGFLTRIGLDTSKINTAALTKL